MLIANSRMAARGAAILLLSSSKETLAGGPYLLQRSLPLLLAMSEHWLKLSSDVCL